MDLVYHERIRRQDVAVLKPATRDSGCDDDHVPARGLGRSLALPVYDSDLQCLGAKDRLGDWPYRERLAGACTGHDSEPLAFGGQLSDLTPMLFFQDRRNSQSQRELDGFAGCASRGDDDEAPRRRLGSDERFMVWRK